MHDLMLIVLQTVINQAYIEVGIFGVWLGTLLLMLKYKAIGIYYIFNL